MRGLGLFVFILFGFASVVAQIGSKAGELVEISPEIALLTIASQPNCPIRIENPKLVYDFSSKDFRLTYKVLNISKRSIVSFALSKWNIGGGGGDLSGILLKRGRLLSPGKGLAVGETSLRKILPLDDALREKIGLKKSMTTVIVVFVKEVRFSDGSVFESETIQDKFLDYLSRTTVSRSNS
jgi:hypothetical protein